MPSKNLGSTVSRTITTTTVVPGSFSFDIVKSTAGTERVIIPISLDVVLDADAAGITGVSWDGTGDKFDKVAHGLSNGDRIVVQGSGLPIGTAPNQLAIGNVYVVLNATTNDFDLALADTPTVPIDLGASNPLTGVTFYKSTARLWSSLEVTIGSQGGFEWAQVIIRSYAGSGTDYATAVSNIQGANPATFQAAATGSVAGPAVDRGAFLTASGDTA